MNENSDTLRPGLWLALALLLAAAAAALFLFRPSPTIAHPAPVTTDTVFEGTGAAR